MKLTLLALLASSGLVLAGPVPVVSGGGGSSTLPSYVVTNAPLNINNGGTLTNLMATNLVGSLPVASLPTGLSTNALSYNASFIPSLIATNPLKQSNLYIGYNGTYVNMYGDSVMMGTLSDLPSPTGFDHYSFGDYVRVLSSSNYMAAGSGSAIATNINWGWPISGGNGYTLDYMFGGQSLTNVSLAYQVLIEAGVADILIGNCNSKFPTPDLYYYSLITNLVAQQLVKFGRSTRTVICTPVGSQTASAWTNNHPWLFTNLFTFIRSGVPQFNLTNLNNYAGTNAAGFVITTNLDTYDKYVTYIYNVQVALLKFAATYGGSNYVDIARFDNMQTAYGASSPDGWHPNTGMQVEFGKRVYDAWWNSKKDYTEVPIPQGFFLVSNGFGPNTLSRTLPISQIPTNVVPSIAFQLHDQTNSYTATTTYSALTNYTTLQNMRSDIFGGNLSAGYITNLVNGTYLISFNCSVRFGANNTEAIFTVLTNGVDAGIESWWGGSNPASATSGSAIGVLYLPANSTISVGVKVQSGTLNITNVAGGLIVTKQ